MGGTRRRIIRRSIRVGGRRSVIMPGIIVSATGATLGGSTVGGRAGCTTRSIGRGCIIMLSIITGNGIVPGITAATMCVGIIAGRITAGVTMSAGIMCGGIIGGITT